MIEIWQADADGKYPGPGIKGQFTGFGRHGTGTAADGSFLFSTIKPGSFKNSAPHINVIVFMRGLQTHAYTRIYFSDELTANHKDAVLNSVDAVRRITLIAERNETGGGIEYRFDIFMQGEKETVFFDV
jgi:protocatechuate 3,4-dioxygenase alpha subunit